MKYLKILKNKTIIKTIISGQNIRSVLQLMHNITRLHSMLKLVAFSFFFFGFYSILVIPKNFSSHWVCHFPRRAFVHVADKRKT